MRNFARINNYYNKIQARIDWDTLAQDARKMGLGDVVDWLNPPPAAGWRTIDSKIAALRRIMEEKKQEQP